MKSEIKKKPKRGLARVKRGSLKLKLRVRFTYRSLGNKALLKGKNNARKM